MEECLFTALIISIVAFLIPVAWLAVLSAITLPERKAGEKAMMHPLQPGQIFHSPGGTCTYRVIGAVCQLYDRSQLPYPCCRLSWEGKEPFWNRIGRRFVPDIAAMKSPSYCVQLIDYPDSEPVVKTLFWVKLEPDQQQWWYSKRLRVVEVGGAKSNFRLGEAAG